MLFGERSANTISLDNGSNVRSVVLKTDTIKRASMELGYNVDVECGFGTFSLSPTDLLRSTKGEFKCFVYDSKYILVLGH
jgi:hypothetical protein